MAKGTCLSREAEEIVSRVGAQPMLLGKAASSHKPEHEGLTGIPRVGAQPMLDETLVSRFMGGIIAAIPPLRCRFFATIRPRSAVSSLRANVAWASSYDRSVHPSRNHSPAGWEGVACS
jgi:hypothetical protein